MGMSVAKLKARRNLPWPRYRVSVFDRVSFCWRESPKTYYSVEDVLGAVRIAQRAPVEDGEVRVCTMYPSGGKHDVLLNIFEKERKSGQA